MMNCKSVITPQIKPSNSDQVWTLKNVTNEQRTSSKKSVESKQQIYAEPSIFKTVDEYSYSNSFINPSSNQYVPVKDS